MPNSSTTVESQETITFKATVAMHNWAHAKASFYLLDASDNSVLDSVKIEKVSYYIPDTMFVKNVVLSWTNNTASSVNVNYEIRGWGNMGGGVNHDNLNVIHIFRDFAANSKGYTRITSGTYSNFGVNFRYNYYKMKLTVDDSIDDANTHYDVVGFYGLRADSDRHIVSDAHYIIELSSLPIGIATGDEFYIGVTAQGRFIATKSLDVDYKITSLEFQPYWVQDATPANPGIIRVYPNDSKTSAVNLEVEGASHSPTKVQTDLDVKLSGSTRTFTIDGFDASSLPNNRAEITGKLIVLGRPIVKDDINN